MWRYFLPRERAYSMTGGKDLSLRLEDEGYGPILREAGLAIDVPDEALLVPKGPELDRDEAAEPAVAAR